MIAILPTLLGPHAIRPLLEWIFGGSGIYDYYYEMYASYGAAFADSLASSYAASYITQNAASLASVFTFGGTTLLIVVGVAIETFRELEAQLTMRNYKGFLN